MEYFFIYLIIINVIGLIIMNYDKKCAINRKWRVPEHTLFLVAAAFGSFGVLSGMYLFHHKTKHIKFIIGIPAILIAQIYIIVRLKLY